MSARRDTFNFSNRRDGERSRDRDRERDPFDRDRGTDRDDRDRNFNTARYRDHSPVPRSMGSSPPYASRSRDNRPGPAATIGTTKSSSGDQQQNPSAESAERLLADALYQAHGQLAKHAQLRSAYFDADMHLKTITAERDEYSQARFDDFPSARDSLQRRQDAANSKFRKVKADFDVSKSTIGKQAHDFVTMLLSHIASQSKGSSERSPTQTANVASKPDLDALERRLEQKMAAFEKKSADQSAVIATQAEQILTLQKDLETKADLIRRQLSSLAKLQNDTLRTSTELRSLGSRVQALEASLPKINSELVQLESNTGTLRDTTIASRREFDGLRKSNDNMKDALDKLQAAHDAQTADVARDIKQKLTALDTRVQHLASVQDKAPSEAEKITADMQVKLQGFEATVQTVKDAFEQLKAVAGGAPSARKATTPVASGEDISKIAADLKQLQIDQGQNMGRQEVDARIADVQGVFARTFDGLVKQFGDMIDEHEGRLQVVEKAAGQHSGKEPAAEAAEETPTVEPGPDMTAKFKEELATLRRQLEAMRQDHSKVQTMATNLDTAFGSLIPRQKNSEEMALKFQHKTTELLEVLQHAVHNLGAQYNNLTTEDLCRKILRHVSVLSGQKTADDLTRRMDMLERAWQAQGGSANGTEPGTSKKRKTSTNPVGNPGASGSGRR